MAWTFPERPGALTTFPEFVNQVLLPINHSLLNRFILFHFFIFPVLIATLRHGASFTYVSLTIISLFYWQNGWDILEDREKHFLAGLVIFFFFSLLSLLMTEDVSMGFKRMERYLRLIAIIPIYCMLRKGEIETGRSFLYGASVAVFVMLAQALYQVETLNGVVNGAYHKIIFGNMAILNSVLIIAGLAFLGGKKYHYLFSSLAVMAGLYTSVLSGARTAWLFIPFIMSFLLCFFWRDLRKKKWKNLMIGLGLSVLLFCLVQPKQVNRGLVRIWDDYEAFQKDPTIQESSLGARIVMWRNSLLIFKDSPIVGTGLGDFRNDSIKLFEDGISYKHHFAVQQTNAHNLYFQMLAEGGLIGLILSIAIFFVLPFNVLHKLWHKTDDPQLRFYVLAGLISVMAFAWFGASSSWVNRNPMIAAYSMVMLVFLTSASNRRIEMDKLLTEGKYLG